MLRAESLKDYELYGQENRSSAILEEWPSPHLRARMSCLSSAPSDFGIEIKESFQTCAQLLLDFFLAAFEHVHGDVRLSAIGQLYRRLANLDDIL